MSSYLDHLGRDRGHPEFAEANPVVQRTAEHHSALFASEIERLVPAGPAYTLDTWYSDGIIEANPIWSSAWYGCDIVAFAEAVAAAQGLRVPSEFLWHPDPVLSQQSSRLGPLPEPGPISTSSRNHPNSVLS